jgi:hypothetical protein
VCCTSIHVSITFVLLLVKSLVGPPYPYLKDRGMRRPCPQSQNKNRPGSQAALWPPMRSCIKDAVSLAAPRSNIMIL